MRTVTRIATGISILGLGCGADQSEEIARLRNTVAELQVMTGPPPRSLDALYPPAADAPVLLQEMFALGGALSGIAVDLSENDIEQVDAQFEKFKAMYAATARMVPEWEEDYPMEPVERLGEVLQTGDQEQAMAAIGAVGEVCHDCHVMNMAKVHEELGFSDLKRDLESSFVGIEVDLEQRQVENARTQFEAFTGRVELLKGTCAWCHETEPKYFVDASVEGMLEQLGSVLAGASPNLEVAAKLRLGIGTESCFRCHLVHGPAALAKERWATWGNDNRK
jgi:hypothetical protein